jgi:hypothetical protein
MKKIDLESAIRAEIRDIMPNVILEMDDGNYELFGKYRLIAQKPRFLVMCWATEVGVFSNTRTAVSWCVADKFKHYNLAKDILLLDNKLEHLNIDIKTRATLADRCDRPEFREIVGTKLETKLIRKKQVENQLTNCVNLAKYLQQKGFNNETARTGRGQSNKASR